MLGPPGAGKGTQSLIFSKDHKIPHISTGEMMREAVRGESDLGRKVKPFLDAGNLVPDDLVIALIEEKVGSESCKDGFVLDGFPRTVTQASALDGMLKRHGRPLTHIIDFKVPEEILLQRIQLRSQSAGRSDDTGAVAANRLKVYWEQTAPVTHYYTETAKAGGRSAPGRRRSRDGRGGADEDR